MLDKEGEGRGRGRGLKGRGGAKGEGEGEGEGKGRGLKATEVSTWYNYGNASNILVMEGRSVVKY